MARAGSVAEGLGHGPTSVQKSAPEHSSFQGGSRGAVAAPVWPPVGFSGPSARFAGDVFLFSVCFLCVPPCFLPVSHFFPLVSCLLALSLRSRTPILCAPHPSLDFGDGFVTSLGKASWCPWGPARAPKARLREAEPGSSRGPGVTQLPVALQAGCLKAVWRDFLSATSWPWNGSTGLIFRAT